MTARLTENLPLLAGTPNGIKKLRELILELAVRGKLVPQDSNDEPASELLKRIAAERKMLSPKVKTASETSDYSGTFELPESWCWVSFGDIAQHNSGKTLDKGRNSGVPRDYITTSNLYWGRFELSNVRQMLIEEKDLARCTAFKNDLLICEGGEAGRAAVWDQEREICFQNHVHRARFFGEVNPHYAQRYFERLNYSGEIAEYRKGVGISNMSSKALASIPVPLPPLAEQYRIVAKVDELMALCDRLETQQADAESAHTQLVQVLLNSLTQAIDDADFATNWQRLAEHFHTLFTTETSIDALKQTLLQLAVMGKLVAQDPNDEPASVLLERIAEENTQLVAEGKLKKQKLLLEISDEEKLFQLPAGWEWVRLGSLSQVKGGKRLPAGATFESRKTPNVYIQVTNMKGGTIIDENLKYIDEVTKAAIKQYTISKDDVYITIAGTIGDVGIVPEHFDGMNLTENAAKIVFQKIYRYWLQKALSSQFAQRQFSDNTKQLAQPKLALHRIADLVLALPPLPEQHRIVAKVDQLVALCDQLKSRLTQARQLNEQLASTLVEQAVA